MRGVILVLFVLLGNYIALVPALSRRHAGERAITVAVVSAVVQPGRAVSSTPADRPAHLADAALYQGATWRIRLSGRPADLADAALYQGATWRIRLSGKPADLADAALYQGSTWRIRLNGRPADLADAALYQGSAAAKQHPPIHGRPERAAATHRVARQARTIHL